MEGKGKNQVAKKEVEKSKPTFNESKIEFIPMYLPTQNPLIFFY